jgi:hypothetical protein
MSMTASIEARVALIAAISLVISRSAMREG